MLQPKKTDPTPKKKEAVKVVVKVVKDANGGRSTRTVATTSKEGTPDTVIKGTPSTTVKGKEGSPAVLASKGVKGNPEFDKAFGKAKSAGNSVFSHGGKMYKVAMSGTKGKPAVNPTPDIVTVGTPDRVVRGTPPSSETKIEDKPIPSEVYTINATRGTIGGARRPGVIGSVTPAKQVTANKDMADRVAKVTEGANSRLDKQYATDTKNERGLNPEQLKLKNAKAEQRRKDLKGSAGVTLTPVQSGLERKKVEELRNK